MACAVEYDAKEAVAGVWRATAGDWPQYLSWVDSSIRGGGTLPVPRMAFFDTVRLEAVEKLAFRGWN
jgi:hypothetical protein